MLLHIEFPLCDARCFLGGGGGRVYAPSWPWPEPGREFVRSFGAVHRRPLGGHAFWADEAFFASAHRAVKYDHLERQRLAGAYRPRNAFRRLLCNGKGVVRLEIGVTPASRPHNLPGDDVQRLLHDFLDLPLRVRQPHGLPLDCPMLLLGKPVASLYAEASRSTDAHVPTGEDLVVDARPIVLVEYAPHEAVSLPRHTRRLDTARFGGLSLSVLWHAQRGRELSVWFLQQAEKLGEQARRLRVGLLRLHAEHQILKHVLTLLGHGKLEYVPRSGEADLVDEYLNRTTRLFSARRERLSHTQALQEELFAYDQLTGPAERDLLLQKLKDVRRQVRKKVETHLDSLISPRSSVSRPPAEGSAVPARSYRGTGPYAFVSYAHADKEQVYPQVRELHEGGLPIWYDEGIAAGTIWPQVLAEAIEGSACFLVFLSAHAVQSSHCLDEIHFALEKRKAFIAVFLEPVALPGELALQINRHQAIHQYTLRPQDYQERLRLSLGSLLQKASPPAAPR